jgi:pimeloyl-ACP methyl ester carboxylesterase
VAHGSLENAQFWQVLADVLAPHLTIYALDRRGHGASGDNPEHSIEREQEDIAAVLDLAGPDAILLGHSYGAVVTLGLALARPLAGLILYEPPLALDGPVGGAAIEPYEEAVRQGDLDGALALGLVNFVGMPQPAIDGMRQEPVWPALASMAPSWPREIQAIDNFGDDLARFAAVDIPVLLIVGELSPAWLIENSRRLQQTMPNAGFVEISGHAHVAHNTDPNAMAEAILEFISKPTR